MGNTFRNIKLEKMKRDRKIAEILLDLFHRINMDELNSISESNISRYKNSSFTFREIKRELDYSYDLLNEGKCLMAVALLRNTFEDLMYFFATCINNNISVDVETKPGELRQVVKDNAENYFGGLFKGDDFKAIYDHLSKMVHVTSIKECINYLDSKSKYRIYIATEIKSEVIMVECMLMQFLEKRGKYRNNLQGDTLLISSTISMLNAACFAVAFRRKHNRKINEFFYDDKSRNYLRTKGQDALEDLRYLKEENDKLTHIINESLDKLESKYNQLGYEKKYEEIAKELLAQKLKI